MKLKRFLLRYYPPGMIVYQLVAFYVCKVVFESAGVILEYELRDKTREMKEIDLLHLTPE